MTPSLFITFEGGEGVGKSTQVRILVDRLRESGADVVVTREPGGSPFAEAVRALILDPALPAHSQIAETLLFYAARADHLEAVIRPALARGAVVICDRFSDSTRAYQSRLGGIGRETFAALERVVVGETRPDLTLVLDAPVETSRARTAARGAMNRYDAREASYHELLRAAFLAIAREEPSRCVVIDAARDVEAVAAAVWLAVARWGNLGQAVRVTA